MLGAADQLLQDGVRDVAQFQQAEVGEHAEEPFDEGQQNRHEAPGDRGPDELQAGPAQKGPAQRLVVDHVHGQVQQGRHAAGKEADIEQLAAAADASQVQRRRGRRAEQQQEHGQVFAHRQHDNPGNDAREQERQLRAVGNGHGHAEEDHGHGLGLPGIAGSRHGRENRGHGQPQGAGQAIELGLHAALPGSACTFRRA